jgi:hypothetical protein
MTDRRFLYIFGEVRAGWQPIKTIALIIRGWLADSIYLFTEALSTEALERKRGRRGEGEDGAIEWSS